MNKNFIKKMIKAKKLEYEAVQELMPDGLKSRINNMEKEVFNLLKDLSLELLKDEQLEKMETNTKQVKKIGVDFK
ncbi:hypothetical protein AAGC94_00640 [Clostridium sporogenes]|uniref:Uncharacterized protein n=1 Tax=Clostridium sporogenes TaxID=1509 RepID=A0A7X5PAE9_CLOSG|nr:hypothetical protein [Clostridium sporogenes]AJD30849.1 hypothetical protein T258_2884 [Clostridium botulinum Prevot_594]AVP60702.1 hypothetical protein C7M79_08285 [Clostridium botulinum]AKC61055.1 hypothetical protein CLSPO_c03250 [Clostridium sporogenes]AKJ88407.1 hypothetical protein CLSPOx_01625 [Clostridium sporogenes]EHN14930.1 hypothetical protein IYC_11709 [Clostridium sporogenes PA 3679]